MKKTPAAGKAELAVGSLHQLWAEPSAKGAMQGAAAERKRDERNRPRQQRAQRAHQSADP